MADTVARLNAALSGRYHLERQLGEGGMATVYLASDLRHDRKVALKVLRPDLAAVVGAERFLAEIRTTANLQHPHILPLFDSGEADGLLFYVMPRVEGESLRERLDREHQLPIDEAVRIATNVAEALDYAHRHGVIHRDIKPANILLHDGKPVVSDFGIALAVSSGGAGRLTETGLSLGTPHYMSPEQATGDEHVGPATDIWALGCVLYEMLVGEPPYTGSTPQAVLGKIITAEPPSLSKARKSVPSNVDASIRRALEKVPADRFRSASAFAAALADRRFSHDVAATTPVHTSRGGQWRRPLAAMLIGVVVLFAIWLGWTLPRPAPPQPVSRHVLSLQGLAMQENAANSFGRYVAIAPDGSSLILPVPSLEGSRLGPLATQLGLKMRGSPEITPISGTEGASSVVYSPDGLSIAYRRGPGLFRQPLQGGAAVRLAADLSAAQGFLPPAVAWLEDGTLLYERRDYRIVQIPESGGDVLNVYQPLGPISWVRGLPGGRRALVGDGSGVVHVLDLEDLSSRPILERVLEAWYASTGHLVFVREDREVFAVHFDIDAVEIVGQEIPLFSGVRAIRRNDARTAEMQLGADGTLVYLEGAVAPSQETLVLVDRSGRPEPLDFDPGAYFYPRFSPDGSRLAVAIDDGSDFDLWVLNLLRGTYTRVTFGGDNRFYPIWHPDGTSLTHTRDDTVTPALLSVATDGSGRTDTLHVGESLVRPNSWSRDGSVLIYTQVDPVARRDLWALRDGVAERLTSSQYEERNGVLSPDGQCLAYQSDRSGDYEVYVRVFPGEGDEHTISSQGGFEPVWHPIGSQLFYRSTTQMMAVPIDTANGCRPGSSSALFDDPFVRIGTNAANYDVAPDGRFVMVRGGDEDSSGAGRLILVENFFEELERLAPN